MKKVFINENELVFLQVSESKEIQCRNSKMYKGKKSLTEALYELESGSQKSLCLIAEDFEEVWNEFSSRYELIEASGGLVKNEKDEILFIFRRGKWDLPKGKLEKNENIQDCAIREVEEECGIKHLKIIKELPSSWHTYHLKGKPILKRTYWFEMITTSKQKLNPQLEEDITELKWLNRKEIPKILNKSFLSISELVKNYFLR
jgi:8-oxo-dGTP pyrophosphatase MutT (NUDIX family)